MVIYWNGKDIIAMSIMMLLIIIIAMWSLYNWIVTKYREYNSSEGFIKRRLKEIIKDKPHIKIRYYQSRFCLDNDHFICFETLEDLNSVNIKEIDLRFLKKFPDELLSFVLLKDYLEFGEDGILIFKN
jgi:hypothetical protein